MDVQGAVHVESEVNKKKSLNSAGHPLLQATLAADSIMHSDDRPNCGGHVALWVMYTSVLEREREYEGLKKKFKKRQLASFTCKFISIFLLEFTCDFTANIKNCLDYQRADESQSVACSPLVGCEGIAKG